MDAGAGRHGPGTGGETAADRRAVVAGRDARAVLADPIRLPPASVIVWTGDNPSSLVGTGLVAEGRLAISLGTSDTVFAPMATPEVDASGTGHVFGAPTGGFMGLTCFQNGSLAREQVRAGSGYRGRTSRALAELRRGAAAG